MQEIQIDRQNDEKHISLTQIIIKKRQFFIIGDIRVINLRFTCHAISVKNEVNFAGIIRIF